MSLFEWEIKNLLDLARYIKFCFNRCTLQETKLELSWQDIEKVLGKKSYEKIWKNLQVLQMCIKKLDFNKILSRHVKIYHQKEVKKDLYRELTLLNFN